MDCEGICSPHILLGAKKSNLTPHIYGDAMSALIGMQIYKRQHFKKIFRYFPKDGLDNLFWYDLGKTWLLLRIQRWFQMDTNL